MLVLGQGVPAPPVNSGIRKKWMCLRDVVHGDPNTYSFTEKNRVNVGRWVQRGGRGRTRMTPACLAGKLGGC